MFSTRTTAEIRTRKQYLRTLVTCKVEYEIRIGLAPSGIHARFAVIQITPLVKQVLPETRPFDGFQKLLGNDGVGIDISAIERRHQSVAENKFFTSQ